MQQHTNSAILYWKDFFSLLQTVTNLWTLKMWVTHMFQLYTKPSSNVVEIYDHQSCWIVCAKLVRLLRASAAFKSPFYYIKAHSIANIGIFQKIIVSKVWLHLKILATLTITRLLLHSTKNFYDKHPASRSFESSENSISSFWHKICHT